MAKMSAPNVSELPRLLSIQSGSIRGIGVFVGCRSLCVREGMCGGVRLDSDASSPVFNSWFISFVGTLNFNLVVILSRRKASPVARNRSPPAGLRRN